METATRRPIRWVSREPEGAPRGDQRLANANRSRRRASKIEHTSAQWPILPHCQQRYYPALGLGRGVSFLGGNRRRELSPPPGVEPAGTPGRVASCPAPAPGVEASTAPKTRTGASRGGCPRAPPYSGGEAATRACHRSRVSSASTSRSLVRSLSCESPSQRCSSPLVLATRANSAIVMPGVFRS